VHWADFRTLDTNVDVAATQSKTIRYQMERVRRWAKADGYRLIHEVAYIEKKPDRATDACRKALERARKRCPGPNVALVYLDFADKHSWRRNLFIPRFSEELGFQPIELSPHPIEIDGVLFNPVDHFMSWRERQKPGKANLRQLAEDGLFEAFRRFQDNEKPYARMAEWLNGQDVKTTTGLKWSNENVRKAIKTILTKIEPDATEVRSDDAIDI
jgi:hypothetical protein